MNNDMNAANESAPSGEATPNELAKLGVEAWPLAAGESIIRGDTVYVLASGDGDAPAGALAKVQGRLNPEEGLETLHLDGPGGSACILEANVIRVRPIGSGAAHGKWGSSVPLAGAKPGQLVKTTNITPEQRDAGLIDGAPCLVVAVTDQRSSTKRAYVRTLDGERVFGLELEQIEPTSLDDIMRDRAMAARREAETGDCVPFADLAKNVRARARSEHVLDRLEVIGTLLGDLGDGVDDALWLRVEQEQKLMAALEAVGDLRVSIDSHLNAAAAAAAADENAAFNRMTEAAAALLARRGALTVEQMNALTKAMGEAASSAPACTAITDNTITDKEIAA